MSENSPDFLAHYEGDSVGVAVDDLKAGPAEGGYLRGRASVTLTLLEGVPLGHKVALKDISAGEDVIEYGARTAVATEEIKRGALVHVHNVRSARWQNSVA